MGTFCRHCSLCKLYFCALRLLLLEGGPGSPSCLLGGKHIVSWGFEDMLPAPDANTSSSGENKGKLFRVCQYQQRRTKILCFDN